MKIKSLYILIAVVALIITATFITALSIDTKSLKSEVVITISEGSGTKQIANKLKENKIIKSKLSFISFIKKNNATKSLKPGIYKFGPGKVAFDDILNKLIKGTQEESITITIPEGYTVVETAALFEEKGLSTKDKFLEYAANIEIPYEYIKKGTDYRQLEGFLFPDTYSIPISWTEKEIINMLLKQFDKNWTEEYDLRAKELNLTVEQVISIASLIEREAKLDNERALISSVIHNRIKKGMLLQIDATVQYLLPKQKSRLLYKDLEVDSPYNTYKYAGLPPTAIAAPGISCIEAALYPEDTSYYYYRAKTIGDGSHYFSQTLEQHNSYAGK